ncbi:MAG: heme ABC exporter ATP-binding protein CcmA [Anaerolineaceae bacterium]|nr:heme ABC exporter ATP-binding protein CcmA [Anaerolineaceae bacterium]
MLNASNLFKSFGSRRVLRGVNIKVDRGEIVALIGVNGAGKSTLLRILSTLTRPDGGRISLDGNSIREDPIRVRQRIGVVLHSPMLYGSLTARENLQFFSRMFGAADSEKRISMILDAMNLSSRAEDLVRTYSRGMQQRLSIARALLHDPDYLLMDEPLTGLDDDSIEHLIQYLKHASQQGKAILFATHDLERACELATRADTLHRGVISDSLPIDDITPEKLRERYHQLTAVDQSSNTERHTR